MEYVIKDFRSAKRLNNKVHIQRFFSKLALWWSRFRKLFHWKKFYEKCFTKRNFYEKCFTKRNFYEKCFTKKNFTKNVSLKEISWKIFHEKKFHGKCFTKRNFTNNVLLGLNTWSSGLLLKILPTSYVGTLKDKITRGLSEPGVTATMGRPHTPHISRTGGSRSEAPKTLYVADKWN